MIIEVDKKNRIVQFISSKNGEGTTTLTKAFAKISAEIFDNSVLLIDTSLPKSKSIYTLSNTIERNGLKSILSNQVQINQFFQRDKENKFYVFPILSILSFELLKSSWITLFSSLFICCLLFFGIYWTLLFFYINHLINCLFECWNNFLWDIYKFIYGFSNKYIIYID